MANVDQQIRLEKYAALLCVDDEPSITNAIARALRKQPFRILTCNDPSQALDLFEHHEIGVVISDFRMPGMTGVELLRLIRERHPETIRLMLTGQADMASVVDAINHGAIFKFLEKPWDTERLEDIVDESFRLYHLEADNRRLTRELQTANLHLLSLNSDLNERVEEKAAELIKTQFYDPDTKLPNRNLAIDRIDQLIDVSRRKNGRFSVIVVGIDQFDEVNETFGSHSGAELMRELARRFQNLVRRSDIVSRIDSNKFCLIISDNDEPEDPGAFAARAFRMLSKPVSFLDHKCFVRASVGIAMYPEEGATSLDLLSNAESALSEARRKGSNEVAFYLHEHSVRAEQRMQLEADLHTAIQNQEFILYYQPRVCARTLNVVCAEALLRWEHPSKGLISPGEFIPVLEGTGLIEAVGLWIFREANDAVLRWRQLGFSPHISVNISPRQFRNPEFLRELLDATERCRLGQECSPIELEITESLLMEDADRSKEILAAIHGHGFKLAIDDFGTGYSSLSYLTSFPIDDLKIDRSFVSQIGASPDADALVRGIANLAQSLRLRVIAEGVETEEQVQALRVLGCDEFQGFYFYKPLTEGDFLAAVTATQALNAAPEQVIKLVDVR